MVRFSKPDCWITYFAHCVEDKPDYVDAFDDNMIFRWNFQIGKVVNSFYMQDVITAKWNNNRGKCSMKTIQVVAAIICDNMENPSKIFATAKGYGEFKGQWEFPGGKLEAGE